MTDKNFTWGGHDLEVKPERNTTLTKQGSHEFTLDEAIAIAKRNDPGDEIPSVSRVLLAEINRLQSQQDATDGAVDVIAMAAAMFCDNEWHKGRRPTAHQIREHLRALHPQVAGSAPVGVEGKNALLRRVLDDNHAVGHTTPATLNAIKAGGTD